MTWHNLYKKNSKVMRCTKIWSKTRLRWCTISFPIIMLRRKLHVTLYDSEHFKVLNKLMLSTDDQSKCSKILWHFYTWNEKRQQGRKRNFLHRNWVKKHQIGHGAAPDGSFASSELTIFSKINNRWYSLTATTTTTIQMLFQWVISILYQIEPIE